LSFFLGRAPSWNWESFLCFNIQILNLNTPTIPHWFSTTDQSQNWAAQFEMESVQDSSQAFVGLRAQLNNAELQHKSLLSQLEVFHYRRLLLCVEMTRMHEEDPSPAPFIGEAAVKFSWLEDKDSDLMDEADEFCKQLDDFYNNYGRTFAEIAKFLTSAGALPVSL